MSLRQQSNNIKPAALLPGTVFRNAVRGLKNRKDHAKASFTNFKPAYICRMEKLFSLNEIVQTAGWLLENLDGKKIIAFYGDMGAGKTTFIYTLCQILEVEDVVSSPTFSIINEYRFTDNGQPASVYHMDLYRLQDEEEAIRAGVEDCLYSGHYCFVEWPEEAPDLFPEATVYVSVEVIDAQTRKIEILKK